MREVLVLVLLLSFESVNNQGLGVPRLLKNKYGISDKSGEARAGGGVKTSYSSKTVIKTASKGGLNRGSEERGSAENRVKPIILVGAGGSAERRGLNFGSGGRSSERGLGSAENRIRPTILVGAGGSAERRGLNFGSGGRSSERGLKIDLDRGGAGRSEGRSSGEKSGLGRGSAEAGGKGGQKIGVGLRGLVRGRGKGAKVGGPGESGEGVSGENEVKTGRVINEKTEGGIDLEALNKLGVDVGRAGLNLNFGIGGGFKGGVGGKGGSNLDLGKLGIDLGKPGGTGKIDAGSLDLGKLGIKVKRPGFKVDVGVGGGSNVDLGKLGIDLEKLGGTGNVDLGSLDLGKLGIDLEKLGGTGNVDLGSLDLGKLGIDLEKLGGTGNVDLGSLDLGKLGIDLGKPGGTGKIDVGSLDLGKLGIKVKRPGFKVDVGVGGGSNVDLGKLGIDLEKLGGTGNVDLASLDLGKLGIDLEKLGGTGNVDLGSLDLGKLGIDLGKPGGTGKIDIGSLDLGKLGIKVKRPGFKVDLGVGGGSNVDLGKLGIDLEKLGGTGNVDLGSIDFGKLGFDLGKTGGGSKVDLGSIDFGKLGIDLGKFGGNDAESKAALEAALSKLGIEIGVGTGSKDGKGIELGIDGESKLNLDLTQKELEALVGLVGKPGVKVDIGIVNKDGSDTSGQSLKWKVTGSKVGELTSAEISAITTGIKTGNKGSGGEGGVAVGGDAGMSFDGGCLTTPTPVINAKMRCSNAGCRATCLENYQFPDGEPEVVFNCEDGEWFAQDSEWEAVPACEPICLPRCENNGICIGPNQCNCPENFTGPRCQFENKPCLAYPPMALNSKRSCRSSTCTITCLKGYTFPDSSSITTMLCKDGNWVPSRENWPSIPDCQPTCEPPCENGGNCLSYNVCQCPQEFRGSQCQYPADVCSAKKLMFNGGYNCTGTADTFSCSVNCPEGIPFNFEPAPVYTCEYAIGAYTPSPVPQCVYGSNVVVGDLQTESSIFIDIQNSTYKYGRTNIYPTKRPGKGGGKFELEWEFEGSLEGKPGDKENQLVVVEEKTPEPSSCFTWGGAHYKTFDGKVYSFDSDCPHTLVRDGVDNTFSIVVQNSHDCGVDEEKCYRKVKIFVQDNEYILKRSDDGMPIFTTPKKILPIPGQVPGIRAEMQAHYIQLSLDTIGAKLKWDGKQFIQVEINEGLWNRTAGLCGKADKDASNDLMSPNGLAPKNIITLANSWQVNELNEECNSIPKDENVCESKTDENVAQEAAKFCKKLLTDKRFSPCYAVMDASLLLDACRWDFCNCQSSNPQECACNTMNVYVRECTHKGVKAFTSWRDEDTCPMTCREGKVYMPCRPKGGQAVCGAAVEKSEDGECEEGCYCPAGTVLHENKCITRDKCPCQLRGKEFPGGSSVPKDCNTCNCIEGQWVCTQVSCGSRCSAIGDPHYVTFDGKRYDFMGQCSYYLVKTPSLSIEAENIACAGSISLAMNFPISVSSGLPSCTKTVTIRMLGETIKLKQGQGILVNDKEITKLPYTISGITIRGVSSIFVIVELPNGMEVWWDGVTRAYIDIPAGFEEQTAGLCGSFNNNQNDDFLTPERDIEQAVVPFANKWKTKEKCNDVPDRLTHHPCDVNIQNKATAEDYCKKIKSNLFSDCHWHVDPEAYYQDCLYDMCSCEGKVSKCLCATVAAYAQECANKGILVDWRNEIGECGVQCTGGQKYQVCGNSCKRTCFDIAIRPDCKQKCVEGCNCPEGETLDVNGECIPIGLCGCQYEGIDFPAGYKEVRPASKGPELCTCTNALWNCNPATPQEILTYPKADLKGMCRTTDNYEFTTCEQVAPKTCKNMHSFNDYSPSVCHAGCKCRDGYVLDSVGKKCVLPQDCPCHHGGKSYKDNSKVQMDCNTCTCHEGKWKCTDRQCSAECSAWGDSHFKTFDGKMYDFQGQCDYVLAKGMLTADNTFDFAIQNVPCSTLGVSCSKSIIIKVGSGSQQETIVLTKDKKVPDVQILKRMTLRNQGLFVIVEAPDLGLVIHWDKGTRVYVKVDPRWKNKVKGLCGNYNNDQTDDFQTPSGGLAEVSAQLFGDSWKLQSYCANAEEIENTCEERPERKVWAMKECGILKSSTFAPCHAEVPVDSYMDKCIFDSCACDQGGDCHCLCTAIGAYAQECNNHGVPIKWRSQELCPMQCDEGCSKYSPCVSTCPFETCDNFMVQGPLTKLCKEDSCVEGCQPLVCTNGEVYLNSSMLECVPIQACKIFCMEMNGITFYEGDILSSDECHTCHCSRGKTVCKGKPCITTEVPITRPNEEETKCVPGWTTWINQDTNPEGITLTETDLEPIPSSLIMNQLDGSKCTSDMMMNIQCRTVEGQLTPKETGLDVECSLEKGLICISRPGETQCPDFETRILCGCQETTTGVEELTTTPLPNICEMIGNFKEHPTDCHKYFQCTIGNVGVEFLEKSCGDNFFYNPASKSCDLPENVIVVKPDCGVTGSTAAPFWPTTAEPTAECVPGWTEWINEDVSPQPDVPKPVDIESIPNTLTMSELPGSKCPLDMMMNIQCRTVGEHLTPRETGLEVECDLEKGLVCVSRPGQVECPDFEISILCGCEETSTETEGYTTKTPPSLCEMIGYFQENPTDCRKFFECTVGTGGVEYIDSTCGGDLFFNPVTKRCDLPETVILIKPECGVTGTTTPIWPETTEPADEGKCIPGWTEWINQDVSPDPETPKQIDVEPIPSSLTMNELPGSRCPLDMMMNIQCRSVDGHLTPKETGLDVECSMERGLICVSSPGQVECPDFEIRILCVCEETTTEGEFTPVPTMPSLCDMMGEYREHTTDCHKFYQCTIGIGGVEYVEKTCGENMLYNPLSKTCDWPLNVILLKPECREIETTVPPVWTEPTEVSAICIPGWTEWINQDISPQPDTPKQVDIEPIPDTTTMKELPGSKCPLDMMMNVQCRTVDGGLTPKETGLDVECSTDKGLICVSRPGQVECPDFEIRILCGCEETTTGIEELTTPAPTMPSLCEMMGNLQEHTTDCQKFYVCTEGATGVEYVEKSCGENMLYNPVSKICDSPENVILVKPDCAVTETTVAPSRECVPGWTEWINEEVSPQPDALKPLDIEPIRNTLLMDDLKGSKCSIDMMTDIHCRTVSDQLSAKETGLDVECSLQRGAVCVSRPGQVECPDFEISIHCGCEETTTAVEELVTPTMPNLCDTLGNNKEHLTDCHKFYECVMNIGGVEFVENTCADTLLFNPVTKTCDFPENVILVKPYCQKETTTEIATTTPAVCVPGWTEFINQDESPQPDVPKLVDVEPIPNTLTMEDLKGSKCPLDMVMNIQCRTVDGHLTPRETGLDVDCNLEKGLVCVSRPGQVECPDFEISILCGCEETTTVSVATEPTPAVCVPGWTEWINEDVSPQPDVPKQVDVEPIPNTLTMKDLKGSKCPLDMMMNIECRTVGEHLSPKETGLDVECNLDKGLVCISSPGQTECPDFEISILCGCEETTTVVEELTTPAPTMPSLCEMMGKYKEHTTDCHKFYVCTEGSTGVEYLEQTCANSLFYNPVSKNCDFPENVILVKPDCEVTGTVPPVWPPTPAVCVPGWTEWINEEVNPQPDVPKQIDVEPIPNTLTMEDLKGSKCPLDMMMNIECRTVGEHQSPKETGLDVECNLDKGLVCISRPGEVECPDFEISILCGCEETTTVIAKTEPTPAVCVPGWTEWINEDVSPQPDVPKPVDIEPIPNTLTMEDLKGSKCPVDMMMKIECRTVDEHLSPKETGLEVECDLNKGLVCVSRPGQVECPDFEISILCGCEETTTVSEELTTPVNLCEMMGDYKEHPTDCHKFYQCTDGVTGVEYVEKTCGENMFYNPLSKTCDWPDNVLLVRPDCGVMGTTVPPGWPPTTETTPAVCVPGWTEWINEDVSPQPDVPKQVDVEPIPNTLTMKDLKGSKCPLDMMMNIECRTVGEHLSPKETGLDVECNLDKGLVCISSPGQTECPDFEISILCGCEETTTVVEELTTPAPTMASLCEMMGKYQEHTTDCHKFYVCTEGTTGVEYLEQTCANSLFYNPISKNCDFPENVILVKPDCGVTGTTVPPGWPPTTEPTSAVCVPGWTEWINEEVNPQPEVPNQIDVEPIPNTLTMEDLKGSKCPLDMMMNIECRTVGEHLSPKETGLDVECNLDKGSVCISRPGQVECPDFEISILCGCEETTTGTILTEPTPAVCVPGWTEFINQDVSPQPDVPKPVDVEPIPNTLTMEDLKGSKCPLDMVMNIQCRTVDGHLTPRETGLEVDCNLDKGLVCVSRPGQVECPDFEISILCGCEETTTVIATTEPTPAVCVPGWTEWINEDVSPQPDVPKLVDIEPIPNTLTMEDLKGSKCPLDMMMNIECRTVGEHLSPKETGLDVECNLNKGLICVSSPGQVECPDFEISILCGCEETTTVTEELTTPVHLCEMMGEYREHPTDCHKFYQCTDGVTGIEYVEKTCGENMFYNPLSKTCDWPDNVLLVRPDCGVMGTTVPPGWPPTTETTPAECIPGWTDWINEEVSPQPDVPKSVDVEPIPNTLTMTNLEGSKCPLDMMEDIRCRTVDGKLSPKEIGLDVECNVDKGLVCVSRPGQVECPDFEISILCSCEETTTAIGELTTPATPTPPNLCEIMGPYQEHPTDCHKFFQCTIGADGVEYVEKTCGDVMFYNPASKTCDLPQNVLLVRPDCGVTGTTLPPLPETTTEEEIVEPVERCPPGEVWDNCAISCNKMCMYFISTLREVGECTKGKSCLPGCVPENNKLKCPVGTRYANRNTCVDVNDCLCRASDGGIVKPGTIYKPRHCEICQCIKNALSCDKSKCHDFPLNETSIEEVEGGTSKPIVGNNETGIIVISTLTPPPLCDEDRFVSLVQGSDPLPDNAFSASSSLSDSFQPKNARFDAEVTANSGGSWSPLRDSKSEYLQIDLGRQEPVYGIVVRGNPLYDEYVRSYVVQYKPDGDFFSYVTSRKKKIQVFRGSTDSDTPAEQLFEVPIEAKVIRIYPQSWHEGISLRVDLIGCEKLSTTPSYVTLSPVMCDDPMGVEDGTLSPQQVTVSSEKGPENTKEDLKINGNSAWQPLTNTPTEFVQFDFVEPRNITGIVTQGGPDGWVTAYKVKYSPNGKDWNPVYDKNLNEAVFLGNFDEDSPHINHFDLPILATFMQIVPVKWNDEIQLRVEPLGCFEPYPTTEPTIITTTELPSPCNKCPDLTSTAEVESGACKCAGDLWWDGESCVDRLQCPCLVGQVSYPVGTAFESAECEECICKLGGVSYCEQKTCQKCDEGLRSIVTATCGCLCQPCDEGQVLCPTSNMCIDESKWCNGIYDCPDDEINCLTTTTTEIYVPPTTPESEECPKPDCPPGYEVAENVVKVEIFNDIETMFSSRNKNKLNAQTRPSSTKGGSRGRNKVLDRPPVLDIEPPAVRKCASFVCISNIPPTEFPGATVQPCPPVTCPEGYIPEYDQIVFNKKKQPQCPRYECLPLPPPDAVCNVTGNTFNTFDDTEYKYDICNHVMARDLKNSDWEISIKKNCVGDICTKDLIIFHDDHTFVLHPDLTIELDNFKYTVEQTKKIGEKGNTFSISLLGDSLLFVSNRHGFWVNWSKQGTKIGVSALLVGKVDGLCGYFNDNPNDDKRKPDGTPGKTTSEFGDSWSVDDAECDVKTCPVDMQNKAFNMCNEVKDQSFFFCGKVVDVDAFVSKCMDTTCNCLLASKGVNSAEDNCRCEALTNFVEECLTADNQQELLDWRSRHDCPVECDAPLIHHDCYNRRCEPTCGSISDTNACPVLPNVCFPGCYCPPGLVRHEDTCIKPSDCRDCECNVLPHLEYITYDETNFTVNGNCVYIMSRDATLNGEEHKFQVLITNHPCDDNPDKMCVGKVTILYNDHKIHILMDKRLNKLMVIVDGERIDDFDEVASWMKVTETVSNHLKLLLKGIQVQVNIYFPSLGVSVKAPSNKYGGKLEGLCGDCNKDPYNDMSKPDGNTAKDESDLASSWLFDLPGQTKETCENIPEKVCEDLPPGQDPCLQILDKSRFGQCHVLLDPSMFVEWCRKDICSGKPEQACEAISAYGRECLNAGICVYWHSQLCPADTCPPGQIYDQCGPSCETTCENLKDKGRTCKDVPTDGCFCPEGKVKLNNTCVNENQCSVCDEEGHHPGDVWKKDVCTTCSCEGTTLMCETKHCPEFETVCQQGFSAIQIRGTENECCDKYICVPDEATPSPSCEPPTQIECASGQVMKIDTKPDGCQQFICQCKPIEDCDPVDTSTDTPLDDGMVKVINDKGCCAVVEYECRVNLCPDPPECPKFYGVKTIAVPGKCCNTYQCEAPKKCIFNREYIADEKGGERLRTPYEQQEVLKDVDEVWSDGPCRECKCMGTDETGYHAICSVTECPAIENSIDSKDYVLEPVPIVDQCCADVKRIGCKDEEGVYQPGEKWQLDDNNCVTMECAITPDGVQKQLSVKTCETTCEIGFEYIPATLESKECCGSCKPVACVIDGVVRKVDEKWVSDDFCSHYVCIMDPDGSLRIEGMVDNCPIISEDLVTEFVVDTVPVEGQCCPTHNIVACKVGEEVYKVGETWPSPDGDKCKNVTCMMINGGELIKQEIIQTCNNECAKGWEYKESQATCCGECAPVACVIGDVLKLPGDTWKSPDGCTVFGCEKQGDQLVVVSFQESCPNIDDCAPENVYQVGCCKHCNITVEPLLRCAPTEISADKLIGLVKAESESHGTCVNKKPVSGFNECVGTCNSGTAYNKMTGLYDSECSCCRATEYGPVLVELECDDGYRYAKEIEVPKACSCEGCAAPTVY